MHRRGNYSTQFVCVVSSLTATPLMYGYKERYESKANAVSAQRTVMAGSTYDTI